MAATEQFDAVVVGSGFGGSVSCYRLRKEGYEVCLLERGKPYPPGSFPRAPFEVNRNFWNPSDGGHGLYQAWSFPGIESVVSAGLGGGSLIYANVMIRKDEKWFVKEQADKPDFEYWPVDRATLEPHYDNVEAILKPQIYPFHDQPYATTPKTIAYKRASEAAQLAWSLPKLAVTFANPGQPPVPGEPITEGTPNLHGRTRYTCRLVGECDVGCNFGSKNSLDYNYLTLAHALGAVIRTRCEVRSFGPRAGGGYWVRYVEHKSEAEYVKTETSQLAEVEVTADRLILSAGVFGSTYLLLKNRDHLPALSPALGTHFSSNGDLLGFVRGASQNLDPTYGPVITSTIRIPDALNGGGSTGRGFYIQEGGFPAFGAWAIETADTPAIAVRALHFAIRRIEAQIAGSPRSDLGGEIEQFLGKANTSAGTMVMLGMGRDSPSGRFSLKDRWLQLDWTRDASPDYFNHVKSVMAEISKHLGGEFTVNPLDHFNKTVTVHGLGGCPMGLNANEGVVDSYGRVFNYPGMFVADGSVMPGAVGPNPSLTIAAVADRFADEMVNKRITAAISRERP
jgi:cholesterol oxidase